MMVAEAVLGSLIAAGLAGGTSTVAHDAYEAWTSGEHPLVQDLTVEFRDELKDELERAVQRSGDGDLAAFVGDEVDWEQVKWNVDESEALTAENQDEAVKQVTDAIVDAADSDAEEDDEEWESVKDAVVEAYKPTIENFYDSIAGTDDADVFAFWTLQRTRDEVGQLREEVRSLTGVNRPYAKLDADEEGFERARNVLDAGAFEFADRPELDGVTGTGKTIVKGWAGSGKTRSLMELLDRIEAADEDNDGRRVEHILVPQTLTSDANQLRRLETDHFRGDVVLVWDDVHAVEPENDNAVFRDAIRRLEKALADDGHDLHVLATVRSEEVEELPNYGDFVRGEQFWSDFETVELRRPDAREESDHERSFLRRVVDHALDYHGVEVEAEGEDESEGGQAVKEALARKAARVEPSPFYVASVAEVVSLEEGVLTLDRVEEIPEDVEELWEDQWKTLPRGYEEPRYVLRALALVNTIGLPLFREPVLGIYQEVFGRGDRYQFGEAVDLLAEQQWVFPRQSDESDETAYLESHDLKLSVVDVDVENEIREFSELLEDELEEFLPEGIDRFEQLAHFRFVTFLHHNEGDSFDDIEEKHHQILVDDFDEGNAVVRSNYGLFLQEQGRYEEAEAEYEAAIDADPDDAEAHTNYGVLLYEQGRFDEADAEFEAAIDANPHLAEAHSSYGLLLQEQGRYEEAAAEHEAAIDADPLLAEAHYNYGVLLQEQGRYDEAAAEFKTAIDADPDYATAHSSYGLLLEEQGHYDEAAAEFETAIDADPDHAEAHTNYGILLGEQGRYDEAAAEFEAAIDADPHLAEAHYNYAKLLYEEDEPTEAREYVETLVELRREQGDTGDALYEIRLLVQICEDLDEVTTAIDNCILALELANRAVEDFEDQENWFESRCLQHLEDGAPADVETTYDWALRAVRAYEADVAFLLFEGLWTIREDTGGDDVEARMTSAAGVAYAAHLNYGFESDGDEEPAEIIQTVTPTQLPPSPKSLYDLLALDYPDVDLVPDDESDDIEPLHEDEDAAFGRLMALVG